MSATIVQTQPNIIDATGGSSMDPVSLSLAIGSLGAGVFGAGIQRDQQVRNVVFDDAARQRFAEASGISDAAQKLLRQNIRDIIPQRIAALRSNLDAQLGQARQSFSGVFDQINRSYDAAGNRARQNAVSSGLANTTVSAGMQALNNRERSRALTAAGNQQASLLSNLMGQRAQSLFRAGSAMDNALLNSYNTDASLRSGLAQQLAVPTSKPGKSFFDRLF